MTNGLSLALLLPLASSLCSALTVGTGTRDHISSKKQHQEFNSSAKCPSLWTGGGQVGKPSEVDIVVSHCNHDLSWLKREIAQLSNAGMPVKKITVFSKCGAQVTGAPDGATVTALPNVGRCDHTMAHYMSQESSKTKHPGHIVLFIKDTHFLHQLGERMRPLHEVVGLAAGPAGFGCGHETTGTGSVFHDTAILGKFTMKTYNFRRIASPYADMSAWLSAMHVSLPQPVTPVCHGGVFAASRERISAGAAFWPAMEKSLARSDNIEEGHFAERSWAGLLMKFDPEQSRLMKCKADDVSTWDGTLKGCSKPC
eukprot:TRINITY_DN27460_c0_g1_i1.p1 TRINITY_DN27460_c0_g1~~TRINITY_DN27460_c0_g1_i1.p1  ORF type:complete len:324 (-),score=54.44 TRINITY_DN27460_c0_g1_i1:159-1094(-)